MTDEQGAAPPQDDLWDWLDPEEPDVRHEVIDPSGVTAVMVVHNGRAWLAGQLLSLARLSPRPGRIVAVDNASTDDSPYLLARAADEGVLDAVITMPRNEGFGAAVHKALEGAEPAWVWLLHDDSTPFPDTLQNLLDGAARADAGIVIPKLLQPRRRNYPETLAEAGQSITRGGRRAPSVDAGDIDQQQLEPERVLGGSTAGMLVRGGLWRELGGLAPEVPLHRDGVDLGWRANEAGHTVTTWPAATLTHRQAGRTGERRTSPDIPAHQSVRLAALRLVAARGPRPPSRLGLLTASGARALGFLMGKSPALAGAELRAARTFAATPGATSSLAARGTRDGASVQELLPSRLWSLRHSVDRAGAAASERYRDLITPGSATSIDELTGDDFAGAASERRVWLSPVLVVLLVLLVLGLVAGRSLLGAAAVAGGGMLPAPVELGDAFDAYLRPTVGVGGANAPWTLLAALFSTFALASPGLFATAGLVLLPILAGGAALLLLRRLGLGPAAASATAAAWAGAVVLLGIVGAGDLSGMTLAVTAPMLARSIHRMAHDGTTGAERLRSPAGVAFWLVLTSAAWPATLPLVTLAGAIWALTDKRRWRDLALAAGLPWLFLAPWLPTLLRWPARSLMGADPLAWPDFPPATSALLAGRILPSGIPPTINALFFGVLFVLFIASLVRMGSLRYRLLVLAALALPLAAGVLSSKVALSTHGGEARALLSGWALMVVAALLAPIVAQLHGATDDGVTLGRWATTATTTLVLVGAVGVGSWAWVGFDGPVGRSTSQLPGYVRDVVSSSRETRVLMLETRDDGGLDWNVVDARQPRWGTGERELAGAFAGDFGRLVQSLGAGTVPEDLGENLTALGVSHIYMGGFSEEALASVGNSPGLARAAVRQGAVVWTVAGLPSRARIVSSGASLPVLDGTVEAASSPRHLVLSEEADSRWRASIGGVELRTSPDREPVTFTVPEGLAGELQWGLQRSWGAMGWQAAVAVLVLTLLAPTLGSTTTARRVRE